MKEDTKLQARQINHGQSEIWLEAEGTEVSSRRTLATNAVVNVTRRLCSPEAFEAFYKAHHLAVGHVATLTTPNLEEIAADLKLTE